MRLDYKTHQAKLLFEKKYITSRIQRNRFPHCSKRFEVLNSRAGRAGVVHNFMRGLSLQQTFPLSPFNPEESGANANRVSGKTSNTPNPADRE